jgi:hypothetical protein
VVGCGSCAGAKGCSRYVSEVPREYSECK